MGRSKATRVMMGMLFFFLAAGLASCALPAKKIGGGPNGSAPAYNEGTQGFGITGMEADVIKKVNDLRTHPREWADYLGGLKPGPTGWIVGREDPEKIGEAVAFLKGVKSRPSFIVSRGLCRAASALVADHGPKGLTGHRGSDGNTAYYRMNSYGIWDGKAAENLYYGYKDPDKLIVALLTEGGSQGWEQRNNIFSDDFRFIGVACGMHNVYSAMCVMDFAQEYKEMP